MAGEAAQSTVRRTLHYYGRATMAHKGLFFGAVLVTLGYVFFLSFGNPYVVSLMVDRVSEGGIGPNDVFSVFGPYIAMLIGCNVLGQICSKMQDYLLEKLEIAVHYELATFCFDTLTSQSMMFHSNNFGGALVSQTTRFLNGYSTLMSNFIYALTPLISTTVFTIGMLAPEIPIYAAILVGIIIVYVIVVYSLFRTVLPLNAEAAAASNALSGELSDSITNILAVKTSGREDYEKSLFEKANQDVVDTSSRRMRNQIRRGATASAIIVVIMCFMAVFVAGGNAWFGIRPGTLVIMFNYTYNLTMRLNGVGQTFGTINRAFGDAHDMVLVLDEPRLVADAPDAKPLKVESGDIEFRDLSFHYSDADLGDNVFEHFSLSIPAGQRVGLVGKSGSGKTTLTTLLLRLADVQEGSILIDGQDISRATQVSLRQSMAFVPQEPLLFHRTVAENIAYGRPGATFEEIRDAAEKANALEFIERLPNGFDTITGERGVKLSGGQRQRVAIARAILMDAPILVLDEATSALDSESEALIQQALENLMVGRTSIVIAHRLSTVASLDRIVVISDGKIVEDGTHAELVDAGGEYAGLWERQTGAFLGSDD